MPYDPISLPPTGIVLLKAASIVRERGWAAGPALQRRRDGGVCIMEALGVVIDRLLVTEADYKTVAAMPAALTLALHLNLVSPFQLWGWNDGQCDGGDHCIAVLEAAAYATVEG